MTTGQKLVELSGLASGSALAHLLAVTQGTGTGVDRIVFASQMTVSLEDDQVSVIQRPSELSVSATRAQTEATQALYPAVRDEQNSVAVLLPPNEVFVARSMGRMTVMAAKARQYVVI